MALRICVPTEALVSLARRSLWVLMLLTSPLMAASQELTLDQAISLALESNRQVKIARLEISKSEHDTAAMRTYRFPQFKLDAIEGQLLT